MAYRAIWLDVDGTLMDFEAASRRGFARVMGALGLPAGEGALARFERINRALWSAHERGEIPREQVLQRRFTELFAQQGWAADGLAAEEAYQGVLAASADLIEGAEEALAYLSARYPLYAATNGVAHTQRNKMALAGIDRYFTDLFISEELGCQKPQPGFFRAGLARMGDPDPAGVLMIGDALASDMAGAAAAGMGTCWFNPSGAANALGVRVDRQIARLDQLWREGIA